VAVEAEQVGCMVDFEHAVAAPGEFDYWRTVFPALGGEDDEDTRRAFRTGYNSVRALPDGLARRRPLYRLLNGVYFFESLYVQNQHGPAGTARRAASLRDLIDETVAGLE